MILSQHLEARVQALEVLIGSILGGLSAIGNYLARLWLFWGPRLTDRGFVAAIFANGAVLGFLAIDPAKAQLWQLAIWGAANLFFPLWDSHPAGEKLAPKGGEGDALMLDAVDWTPEIEATLERVIKKYATAGGH